METQQAWHEERRESLANVIRHRLESIQRLVALQSLNDCFYVWHSGPVPTINGFRLGRTNREESAEINAALGEVAHLLSAFRHDKFALLPMGSYSKIQTTKGQQRLLKLFTDDAYTLLPKRNFHNAMISLVSLLQDLTDRIKKSDPAMCQLYTTSRRCQLNDRGAPTTIFTMGDDAFWSKLMKALLIDLKLAVAFVARHGAHYSSPYVPVADEPEEGEEDEELVDDETSRSRDDVEDASS